MFGGRRRAAAREQEALAARLERAVAAAERAARAAEDAAATASAVLTAAQEPRATRLQAVGLPLASLALVLTSFVALRWGTQAFTDPQPLSLDPGQVAMAVETTAADTPTTHLAANFQDLGHTSYVALFLPSYAGRRFTLVLEDAAVLADAHSPDTELTVGAPASCGGAGVSAIRHRCQVVQGVVPATRTAGPACWDSADDGRAVVTVEVIGEAEVHEEVDWAHRQVTLPALRSGFPGEVLDHWDGVPLDGSFTVADQHSCSVAWLPAGFTFAEADTAPDRVTQHVLFWDDEATGGQRTATVARRDAESYGNGLLAGGGALFGLATALCPAAGRAVRSRWGPRRSSAG